MAKCGACGAGQQRGNLKVFQPNPQPQQRGPHMPEGWHLKKEVPIALILALLMQTAGIVWWAATIQAENAALRDRVVILEQAANSNRVVSEKLARVEERVESLRGDLARLEGLLRQLLSGYPGP